MGSGRLASSLGLSPGLRRSPQDPGVLENGRSEGSEGSVQRGGVRLEVRIMGWLPVQSSCSFGPCAQQFSRPSMSYRGLDSAVNVGQHHAPANAWPRSQPFWCSRFQCFWRRSPCLSQSETTLGLIPLLQALGLPVGPQAHGQIVRDHARHQGGVDRKTRKSELANSARQHEQRVRST
jgi:hypothetical protein